MSNRETTAPAGTPASKILADTLRAAGASRIAWARGTGQRRIIFTMDEGAMLAVLPVLRDLPFPVRFANADLGARRYSIVNPDHLS